MIRSNRKNRFLPIVLLTAELDETKREEVRDMGASAWISKPIELAIPADGFTIKFDADMEPSSSVVASYKVRANGDETPFEELDWIDFPADQQITEANYGFFSSDPTEVGYTMRAATVNEFSEFKVRLRMVTENEAQIPRISNLRIIADI